MMGLLDALDQCFSWKQLKNWKNTNIPHIHTPEGITMLLRQPGVEGTKSQKRENHRREAKILQSLFPLGFLPKLDEKQGAKSFSKVVSIKKQNIRKNFGRIQRQKLEIWEAKIPVRRKEQKTKPNTWLMFPLRYLLISETVQSRRIKRQRENSKKTLRGISDSLIALRREKLRVLN